MWVVAYAYVSAAQDGTASQYAMACRLVYMADVPAGGGWLAGWLAGSNSSAQRVLWDMFFFYE